MEYSDYQNPADGELPDEAVILPAAPPPAPSRPAGPSVARRVLSFFMALIFVGSVMMNFVLLMLLGASGGMAADGPVIKERKISGKSAANDKVAVVPVVGVIFQGDSLIGRGAYELALASVRRARKDANVRAVVIEVNSPGGTVSASDMLHHEIAQLAASKPVIVHMGDLAASGGYYVSAPASQIFASPTTITGSIGVMMSSLNIAGLGEKYGVRMQILKSGKHKDVLSMWRPMEEDERKMLQSIVDDMYETFLKVILDGRGDKITEKKLRELADGRIFTASQALELKLVDKIGYREDAVKAAIKQAGLGPEHKVVEYRRIPSVLEMLAASRAPRRAAFGQELLGRLATRAPFFYLWHAPSGLLAP